MGVTAVLLAIFCNILWGTAFPMMKIGYRYLSIGSDVYSQFLFAGIRFLISGVMLFCYSLVSGRKAPRIAKKHIPVEILLIFVGTVLQYGCNYIGLPHTMSANASIIAAMNTFFCVLLSPVFFRSDRLTPRKIAGVIVGLIGVVICSYRGGGFSFNLEGDFMIMMGTLFCSLGFIITKKIGNSEDSLDITCYNLMFGGLILLIAGMIGGGRFNHITFQGVLIILYLALLSALAFTIWAHLLSRYDVSRVTIFSITNPMFGTFFAWLLLGEKLDPIRYAMALACVSIGIILINFTKKKKVD